MITPLYGYDSVNNSYLVDSYPYGGMRCKIKFWVEYKPKQGFRFCSQTQNPKTLRWNNPRQGTYSMIAGCLYLDEKNHVQFSALTEYSDAQQVLEFLEKFPQAKLDNILPFAFGRKVLCQRTVAGKANLAIAGVPCLPSEDEQQKAREESEVWDRCLTLLKKDTANKDSVTTT